MKLKMQKPYVSEFTQFINQYLEANPKVVEEKKRNWRHFWEPKIDRATSRARKEDVVPDDHYGFN